jgi:hypothetical protein
MNPKLSTFMNGQRFDSFKFWVHFACGALFGVLYGLRAWGRSSHAAHLSISHGLLIMSVSSMVWGIIAGIASTTGWDKP